MYGSLGARASKATASMARGVSNYGRRADTRGRAMLNTGMGMPGRRGQAMAMAGSAIGRAGRFAESNPRQAMGIAAGVTGAGAYGVNRRRGSQNYPMY